jgi:hypothetical protein
MAAGTEIKHAGAWRTIDGVEVRHSGSWRDVKTIEVRHSGAWRTVYNSETLALPTSISSTGIDTTVPYSALAGVKVDTNGYMYRIVGNAWSQVSGADYWINNKSATMSNYECKMEGTGNTPNHYGLGLSTWYTLSSDRSWGLNKTTAGLLTFSGTLYIREKADTSNQVTCSISIQAEAGFA